jgi:hypothetical protein
VLLRRGLGLGLGQGLVRIRVVLLRRSLGWLTGAQKQLKEIKEHRQLQLKEMLDKQ